MARGAAKVIRDPAVAVAAAKCWVSRWGASVLVGGIATGSFHPRDCKLCGYDAETLIGAIDEFLDWSQLRVDDKSVSYPEEVQMFLVMSAEAQGAAVRAVQGY